MHLVVFGVTTGIFLEGMRLFFRDRKLRKLMDELERSRNFDLDYLPSIDSLPRDKPICVRGIFKPFDVDSKKDESNVKVEKRSVIDPEELLYLGRVGKYIQPKIPKGEDGEDMQEYMAAHYAALIPDSHREDIVYYLENEKGEMILVKIPPGGGEGGILHNTHIIKVPQGANPSSLPGPTPTKGNLTDLNPWEYFRTGEKFEIGLSPNNAYNFIGKLSLYDGSIPNPRQAQLMLRTKIITGEMREQAMRYLDIQILEGMRRAKLCYLLTAGICAAGIFYRKILQPAKEELDYQKSAKQLRTQQQQLQNKEARRQQ